MRVIGIMKNKHDGPGYHRIMLPLDLMYGVDTHITNVLTEEELEKGCDVVALNRFFHYNKMPQVLEWRDKYGFKLVVDIDDYWHLYPGHIAEANWKRYGVTARIIESMILADVVTCTHERLAEEISQFSDHVEILPNAIPNANQFLTQKVSHEKVRIYWQGSPTHEKDLQLIAPTMRRIHKRPMTKGKAINVLAGYIESIEWHKIANLYTDNGNAEHIVFPGTDVSGYYESYAMADICVIPLVENKFNSFKSNLKVLEAAHMGCPVVASHVNPYLGMDSVMYVKGEHDWYMHLRDLINDPSIRDEVGNSLKVWCDINYNFDQINQKRKEIYEGSKHRIPGTVLEPLGGF